MRGKSGKCIIWFSPEKKAMTRALKKLPGFTSLLELENHRLRYVREVMGTKKSKRKISEKKN